MLKQDRRYLAGLVILLASALLLLLPLLSGRPAPVPPKLNWAPGYWEVLPEIGLARIVPFADKGFVNPATGSGPGPIREPANTGYAPRY